MYTTLKNGRDVIAYFMLGRTETCMLLSVCGGGVGHDVMKILNFSAIQCKFNRCLKNFNYKQ